MIHGANIQDNCIIGIHATVLNGAVIKKGSIIGAHALVTSDTVIPENSLVVGIRGKVIKEDNAFEIEARRNAKDYQQLTEQYIKKAFSFYKH